MQSFGGDEVSEATREASGAPSPDAMAAPTPVQQTADAPVVWVEARELECVRDDRMLFSGLSFRLQAGEVLQVEGRNGSGKTTLLHMLCGLRLPDHGMIYWGDNPVAELGRQFFEKIAYVGHTDGIKRDLTATENLRMASALGKGRMAIDVGQALAHVGLYGFEDVPVRSLSAGQRRRVALARLLMTQAPLWVLDEPYTSLDRHGIEMIERLVHDHVRGGGMVALTTHHAVDVRDANVQHLCLAP